MWTTRVKPIVTLAAAALLAAGCGGEKKEDKGTDLTALKCPAGAKRSFDTAELIRKRLDKARAVAAQHGCHIVVAMEDGKSVPVPVDVDPKRIYVYTKGGVVTEIEGVGGGL
jgi:hypothetical protein